MMPKILCIPRLLKLFVYLIVDNGQLILLEHLILDGCHLAITLMLCILSVGK